ncbi:GGDEF domain-containing protein [Sphingomonas lacusdianchii]|uniref:GGDEF domain-containing protein n=1 Tax=Sphingomonas lacusdianchii TaxID=2917992 RepID=UPI001F5665C6|nr:GGDEF domain-containing protein [Sphingomonas sp. JXJ CY 53]
MLDLSTLYVMVSLASIVAGLIHVVPWATGRFDSCAAWWGFGHILLGITAAGAVIRELGGGEFITRLGNPMAIMAYAAIFIGLRTFAYPDSRNRLLLAGAFVAGIPLYFSVAPGELGMRIAYLSVIRSIFDAAIVLIAIRLARRESLHTAWIVVALFTPTVPLFLARAWSALRGDIGISVTGMHGGIAAWLTALPISFIIFRGIALMTMEAERGHQLLTALLERDPLTDALNRSGFDRRAARWRGGGAALVIDVDHFKILNDRCGHATGDAALVALVRAAKAALPQDGRIFRWGGDEFVCILPGADMADAEAVAAAIGARYGSAMQAIAPADLPVSISVGCALGDLTDSAAMIAAADADMYAVKQHGRERTPFLQRSVAETRPSSRLISHAQHG